VREEKEMVYRLLSFVTATLFLGAGAFHGLISYSLPPTLRFDVMGNAFVALFMIVAAGILLMEVLEATETADLKGRFAWGVGVAAFSLALAAIVCEWSACVPTAIDRLLWNTDIASGVMLLALSMVALKDAVVDRFRTVASV